MDNESPHFYILHPNFNHIESNQSNILYWFDLVQISYEKITKMELTILLYVVFNSFVCCFKLNINDLRAPLMTKKL
jgi:hypothetical protein